MANKLFLVSVLVLLFIGCGGLTQAEKQLVDWAREYTERKKQ